MRTIHHHWLFLLYTMYLYFIVPILFIWAIPQSISLLGSLLSDLSDTRKPSVRFSSRDSSSIIYSAIYSMSSLSEFSEFYSSSSFFVMLSMIGIPGAHSNIGYLSKVGCSSILASSYTLFTTSSSIGISTQLSLWIYFPVYSNIKNVLHPRLNPWKLW